MKLPEIQTKKKIRDAHICSLLVQGQTKEEIADKLGLSVRTIDRVIYKNATVLKNSLMLTKDLEKVKRILFFQNQIRMSKKFNIDLEFSPVTLMEHLQEELEGTQPNTLVDNSQHVTNITVNKIDVDERIKLLRGTHAV